jgi:hypothetical protein
MHTVLSASKLRIYRVELRDHYESLLGKDLKGSERGQFEMPSWNLPGDVKEKDKIN